MAGNNDFASDNDQSEQPAAKRFTPKPSGQVELVHRDLPPVAPEEKRIHQRRPLPQVAEPDVDMDDQANNDLNG